MQEELLDILRNPFAVISLTFLMSLCLVAGGEQLQDAVELELTAYRMHQCELSGSLYGSQNYKIHYEAVSLDAKTLRRCIVANWRDVATRNVDSLLSISVGALLIFIPSDLDVLSKEDRELFINMEKRFLNEKTDLTVYVSPYTSDVPSILSDIESSSSVESAPSATSQLLSSIAANTFQFTSIDAKAAEVLNYKPNNVIARLGSGERSSPTIAFVAHYDTHAAFPGLAAGSDSNGSGIVALLELLALLSPFYDKSATKPQYNLVFVWTAGGKFNYQGARQFIDDFQEATQANDEKLEVAICLDTLGGAGSLRMHASKTPNEDSAAGQLLKRLKAASPNKSIELVTKKINLGAPILSWEHERFNIKRMPAVTLSRLESSDQDSRKTLLDSPAKLDTNALMANIRIIAEAVLGYMVPLSTSKNEVPDDSRVTADTQMLSRDAVDRHRVAHFVRQFASKPRSLADPDATGITAQNIAAAARNYAMVTINPVGLQDVKVWGVTRTRIMAERVKPAVFELFIAALVAVYLYVFYAATSKSQRIIENCVTQMKKSVA